MKAAEARIDAVLIKPLAVAEERRSRFSRARMPPRERRLRMTQAAVSTDASGRAFVPFAVDVRFGAGWKDGDLVGCAYPATGEVFVKRGDTHRPAEAMLGKNVQPVAGVCEAAPGTLAAAAN